jgi:hypothetical protein
MALATTQKGNMSISEYIAKMKSFADEMASAGKSLEDEELVSYILVGLDFDYNSVVSAIVARVEPISFGELYSQLLSFEAHWKLSQGGQQPSTNTAQRGCGGPGPRGHGAPGDRGRGNFFPVNNTGGKKEKIPFQVCEKMDTLPWIVGIDLMSHTHPTTTIPRVLLQLHMVME